ncbi:ABC transporter substrate-binding protein [Haloplasma contractile]|uniref:ABC transporter ligand-binding protein n=1 Tax=Haloplasma contractile SSD-17B TaxID=1033810 RepID=U2DTK4_9MOLU|nr:ABC transporter substrate-binding protein [Haloplasma contractile]ERJ11812.1 ABC transporter ligand-binding protein [Haloplasma contractile SSD-17B]
MKKVLLSLILVFSIFTIVGCTNDGEDQVAQGVTEDKVLVGNTAATSGFVAFVGEPFKAGMDAYFNMVNEDGGVAGREIEYVHYDDGFDQAQGQTYTQKLIEDDQVFALVGHFGTPTVSTTMEYLDTVGIPRVYYATGISALFNDDAQGGERSSFPVQPIYDAEGEVMVARAVAELDAERIGVIYSNADDGKGILRGIQNRINDLDVTLAAISQVASDADDMSIAAQSMISADVDVVIIAANQGPAATAVRALQDAGSTIPVVTSYVNADATWLTGVSDVVDSGSFNIYANAWIDINENQDDVDLFVQEISKINADYAGNAYAFAGWIAAAAFVEGLERVGEDELTWENYIDAMEEDLVELPFGVVVDYSENRRVGTQAMAFLKAASVDDVAVWETEKPIQTIKDIIGE